MAYIYEKTGDIVINGWEKGIQPSPHLGIANMQAVNIATEIGEVMCNFNRVAQQQTSITGTFTISGSTTLIATGLSGTLLAGSWITMTSAGITGLTNGTSYYVLNVSGNTVQLSTGYSNTYLDAILYSTGSTATFTTANYLMGQPIASATEFYTASDSTSQNRYYILDSNGLVWVSDSYSTNWTSGLVSVPLWFLPNITAIPGTTGISVLSGWLFAFQNNLIQAKSTVKLGSTFSTFSLGGTMSISSVSPHFAYTSKNNTILYYTDGSYLGSIYPNSSAVSGLGVNIQSFCSYTASTSTGTISYIINGSIPSTGLASSTSRIPAVFFSSSGGNVSTDLGGGTESPLVYIIYDLSAKTFRVYNAITAGTLLDIQTGSVGTQYFNTFYPVSGSGTSVMVFSPQRLNLPETEISQTMNEIGTDLYIGTKSNLIYTWNQVDSITATPISIPENNISSIINVNNMGYIFAGIKGNIYITNGSSASAVISVPDYCAGIAGTPATYIEPYFTWGGAMYLRGRVYFSIKDQTGTKAGNCGGIWSFVPTQNMFFGQDVGLALRLENQASYGTYNGYSPILIPSQVQTAIAPQYWNVWDNGSSIYGVDFTKTTTGTVATIETDLIPIGTMLNKNTIQQIEYKLSTPLAVGESVAISYRQNSTASYTSCGTAIVESTTGLSGYFTANFEKSQWLQLKIVLTPLSTSSSTFVRLSEIRIR